MTLKTILHGLFTGAAATVSTSVALAALGQRKNSKPFAPFNAVSHIVFGEKEADRSDDFSPKRTLTGFVLHAASIGVWGVLFALWAKKDALPRSLPKAALFTGAVYALDYYVVPERLKPGFERKLGRGAIPLVYAVLGLTLALSPLWRSKK